MKSIRKWALCLLPIMVMPAYAQEDITITTERNTRYVTAPLYQAIVTENGALSSLKVRGQKFFRVRGASRGAYFYQNGDVDLTQIEQTEAGIITAKGEKAKVRYEFKPDVLTWTLTNTTDKYINFFMVLDPTVSVGYGEDGVWTKTPVNKPWKQSTWFAGKSKLKISGATRVWGPWNNLDQVWEATIAPNATQIVELRPDTSNAAELTKFNEISGTNTSAAPMQGAGHNPTSVLTVPTRLSVPSFFADNMVLQREMPNPIWGTATPDEPITVTVDKQTKRVTADSNGKWMVRLDALPIGGPYEIVIKGKSTLTLKNVLCGDVWLCSGQSNMAFSMNEATDGKEDIPTANDSQMRFFKAGLKSSEIPLSNVAGRWVEVSPNTIRGFSAVGYYFGKRLREELGVPIGLITTAWGGTPIEAWLSPESLKADPDYEPITAREAKAIAEKGDARPKNNIPSGLYNAMNVPMAPLAIRGVAFYQGEANIGRAYQYRRLFPLVINDWRKLWKQPDLPFVWVQLPNIGQPREQPGGSGQAELREAQAMALALTNTAMAVTLELGDPNDIHPKFKREVGNRLALVTLQKIYKRNIIGSGPVYAGMRIDGNSIRVQFKETGGGLTTRNGEPLKSFAIAGENKKWVWANAEIEGDTVILSNSQVPAPIAVRYAWADTAIVSLYNKEGLPAAPFRTDDWPGYTVPNR